MQEPFTEFWLVFYLFARIQNQRIHLNARLLESQGFQKTFGRRAQQVGNYGKWTGLEPNPELP